MSAGSHSIGLPALVLLVLVAACKDERRAPPWRRAPPHSSAYAVPPDEPPAPASRQTSSAAPWRPPATPPLTAAAVDAGVLPVVMADVELLEMLAAERGGRVKQPFAGDLFVAYLLAEPRVGTLLDNQDLVDVGRTAAEVERQAKQNLRRIVSTRLALATEPGGVQVIRERSVVDGVLVLDDFWKAQETRIGTPIVVMFPAREPVLFFARESPEALDAMRTAVSRLPEFKGGLDSPGRTLRRAGGTWAYLATRSREASDGGPP